MSETNEFPPPSVAPPSDVTPERIEFRLPDKYATYMVVHRPPAGAPEGKLPVLYLHGIQSHPGWFYGSARALADAGHVVYQFTRRGSGDNRKFRGHAASGHQLLKDLDAAIEALRAAEGADRVHLLGVSWGGKWAAAAAARHGHWPKYDLDDKIASLTLVAPGIASQVDVSPWTKLSVALCALAPLISVAGGLLFEWLIVDSPVTAILIVLAVLMGIVLPFMKFRIPLDDEAFFTDNPAMQDYLKSDPHRLHKVTAMFLLVSRSLDRMIAKACPGAIALPTTLLLATRDRIIDNARTEERLRYLCGGRLSVATLDGAHTLDFETDPRPFYDRLVQALDG